MRPIERDDIVIRFVKVIHCYSEHDFSDIRTNKTCARQSADGGAEAAQQARALTIPSYGADATQQCSTDSSPRNLTSTVCVRYLHIINKDFATDNFSSLVPSITVPVC